MVTNRSSLNKSRSNTDDRDHEDTGSVIIVFVQGPQYEASDLKHIERMECLATVTYNHDSLVTKRVLPRRQGVEGPISP